ncbi:MAG: sigma-E factor negative regulatory protein [Burkholderiales bacterium]|nr:sigma-E factor negative regulatory protein [Burkholderiales bacterium]
MKSRISTFVDGELESAESGVLIEALERDGEARETWRIYHLISDALRDTALRAEGFSARFAERLAVEPTVLAPGRLPLERKRRMALSAAASITAVALVGWLALAPGPEQGPSLQPGGPLAGAPRSDVAARPASPPSAQPGTRQAVAIQGETAPSQVRPIPAEIANDYLFAHQEFSPGMSLQGMAPYIRTVSGTVSEGSRR